MYNLNSVTAYLKPLLEMEDAARHPDVNVSLDRPLLNPLHRVNFESHPVWGEGTTVYPVYKDYSAPYADNLSTEYAAGRVQVGIIETRLEGVRAKRAIRFTLRECSQALAGEKWEIKYNQYGDTFRGTEEEVRAFCHAENIALSFNARDYARYNASFEALVER